MQPDKNVWQRITVISYVCVCVCLWKCVHACVCAFFLQCLNCCQSSSSDSGISICRAERYMWLGYILTGLCKCSSLHSPHRWGRLRMMQRAQWAQHEFAAHWIIPPFCFSLCQRMFCSLAFQHRFPWRPLKDTFSVFEVHTHCSSSVPSPKCLHIDRRWCNSVSQWRYNITLIWRLWVT